MTAPSGPPASTTISNSPYAQGKNWAVQNYNNGDTANVLSPQILVSFCTEHIPASDTGDAAYHWAAGCIAGYYVNHGSIGPSASKVAQSVVNESSSDGTVIEAATATGTVSIAANGAATVPVQLTFSDGTVYDGTATLYPTGNTNWSANTEIGS
jgi:cytochrome c551/c552